jgi:methionyl aminopeptidase
MSIQSERDWRGLRRVGQLVAHTLDLLERALVPGCTTSALDASAAVFIAARGGRSAPAATYGFPGAVLISVNDEIVHGVPGARVIHDGDVVKFDVTLESDGYIADAARTVLVGAASDTAQRLKACAEAAFERALEVATAGALVRDVGGAIEAEVRRQGFHVVPELGGHGVGRRIHERPFMANYADPRQHERLREGLVVAIEPIITAGSSQVVTGSDGWTMRTADGSLAAHYEHTVAITAARPVLLTAA